MVARDQAHNAVGSPVGLRETGTSAGVVEIARERRIAAREASPHARGETRQQHSRDAMPELRVRGLRAVVKEASDDDLVVGTQGAKDPRGLARVALISAGRSQVADRLLHAVEHRSQKPGPAKSRARKTAGPKTSVVNIRAPKKRSNSKRI